MAGEREEAWRDILYSIEQQVSTEVPEVVAFRLEGKNTTAGPKLGGIEGVEANVSANIVKDIAIAQIFTQPLYCLGLLGSVGVCAIMFIRCRDADGDGESVNLAARDWKNCAPGRTKPQHHCPRYSVQFGKEPPAHSMFRLCSKLEGNFHQCELYRAIVKRYRAMHRKRCHRITDSMPVPTTRLVVAQPLFILWFAGAPGGHKNPSPIAKCTTGRRDSSAATRLPREEQGNHMKFFYEMCPGKSSRQHFYSVIEPRFRAKAFALFT